MALNKSIIVDGEECTYHKINSATEIDGKFIISVLSYLDENERNREINGENVPLRESIYEIDLDELTLDFSLIYSAAKELEVFEEAEDNLANTETNQRRAKAVYEEEQRQKENINKVATLIRTEIVKSDKIGYNFENTYLGEVLISSEYVIDETYNAAEDGSYLKPFAYNVGDEVTVDMWYTDGSDIWQAIKSGTPVDFTDTEFFEIIEV